MMLTWAEVKKVIQETVCPPLLPLGFTNPGITMWRHREQFIDVIHFYYGGKLSGFAIDLGCHPRKIPPALPKPQECLFRTRLQHSDTHLCSHGIYRFAQTLETQRELLTRSIPEVVEQASKWWSQFTTISGTLDLLENSSEAELEHLTQTPKDSPAFKNTMRLLQLADS